MNDGGVDAPFVHQDDGLGGGEMRHLDVRLIARQALSPGVDLRVDDLHRMFFLWIGQRALEAPPGMLAAIPLAVSRRAGRSPGFWKLGAGDRMVAGSRYSRANRGGSS